MVKLKGYDIIEEAENNELRITYHKKGRKRGMLTLKGSVKQE